MLAESKRREAGSLLFRMKVWSHDASLRQLVADFLEVAKDIVNEIRRVASAAGPSMARARVMEALATDELIHLFRKAQPLVSRAPLQRALSSTRARSPRDGSSRWEFADLPGKDALEVCQAYLGAIEELAAKAEQLS